MICMVKVYFLVTNTLKMIFKYYLLSFQNSLIFLQFALIYIQRERAAYITPLWGCALPRPCVNAGFRKEKQGHNSPFTVLIQNKVNGKSLQNLRIYRTTQDVMTNQCSSIHLIYNQRRTNKRKIKHCSMKSKLRSLDYQTFLISKHFHIENKTDNLLSQLKIIKSF